MKFKEKKIPDLFHANKKFQRWIVLGGHFWTRCFVVVFPAIFERCSIHRAFEYDIFEMFFGVWISIYQVIEIEGYSTLLLFGHYVFTSRGVGH